MSESKRIAVIRLPESDDKLVSELRDFFLAGMNELYALSKLVGVLQTKFPNDVISINCGIGTNNKIVVPKIYKKDIPRSISRAEMFKIFLTIVYGSCKKYRPIDLGALFAYYSYQYSLQDCVSPDVSVSVVEHTQKLEKETEDLWTLYRGVTSGRKYESVVDAFSKIFKIDEFQSYANFIIGDVSNTCYPKFSVNFRWQ